MLKKAFKLMCRREEIQLLGTLNGGQSFRWQVIKDNGEDKWLGVFSGRLWMLQQHDDHISYEVYEKQDASKKEEDFYNTLLTEYFQLNLKLTEYFEEWAGKDPIFKKAASQFYGIRILKQDLVENIFSFICSSNNNISRISGMVEKLGALFGEEICAVDNKTYFTFPKVEALAKDNVEAILKKESFGYRAKYISQTAQLILKGGGDEWLNNLRQLNYKEARVKLMTLTGIGPKVADCICLMSLGHLQSIPVDTHVHQIARNFYMPKLPKQKTVTAKVYKEIGDHFRTLYGPLAGWAHTVLFCADLKKFQ